MKNKKLSFEFPRAKKDESIYVVQLVSNDMEHQFSIRVDLYSQDFKPAIEKFAKEHNITDYQTVSVSWLANLREGQIDAGDTEYTVRKI
jgi:hypothetical protein